MKKTMVLLTTLFITLLLTSCGMTQELDSAMKTTSELKKELTTQKQQIDTLIELTRHSKKAFDADLAEKPEAGLYATKEGKLYRNVQKRQQFIETLTGQQKKIKQTKKALTSIAHKEAVDVNNQQLLSIANSLDIITNNYEASILNLESVTTLEDTLYQQLPVDNLDTERSTIERMNGSIILTGEETLGNIDYSLNLINTFQKEASVTKE